MKTIFIVTEANAAVATGHLMECIVCAEELMERKYEISFWINDDMENGLKERIPCKFQEYHVSVENDYEVLIKEVCQINPDVLLFNLREISEKFLKICKEKIPKKTSVICIDEFGHRNLLADIVINPMIDSYYWDYAGSKARLFCGAEYLILPKELAQYHKKKKVINNAIQKVVITMGGVDPQNYTVGLIGIIAGYFQDIVVNVVVGGGNRHYKEIVERVKSYNGIYHNKINVAWNIMNVDLLEMMYQADFVICSGGNTLHEAACIGTPAVVIPSMLHEVHNAQAFAGKGFGFMIKNTDILKPNMRETLGNIRSYQVRSKMSAKGRQISDGLGRMRVVEIIGEVCRQ
ncbi:UDP-N-acetylglucosamine--N-acetylmuramyl-(pentapeptide) pyrophosphoryl-undecaprenol N-acetylglucosamine transferase [Lachnospiraceae bacterium]|nr:UDP-N-acetylglucosamine--N-acetylmuramyl-(pentapeptide) pyrophosphoryl-undecaprenol N-acetylglucosamine transferase [Lachnospiraceae bacterium]